MLNKKIIKNNFKKSLKTYDENAIVQKKMAIELIALLNKNYFPKGL